MDDFSERLLCSDGTCVGTINDRGICNICAKPSATWRERKEREEMERLRQEQEGSERESRRQEREGSKWEREEQEKREEEGKEHKMGLKDEIEKLIRTEQDKLKNTEQKDREFYEHQRQRFIPMRAIIEEISKSIEPEYIRVSIQESDARIELGRKNSRDYFEEDVRWEIMPNYRWLPLQKGESLRCGEPGFRVEERITFQYPNYDTSEHTYTFDNEQATAECLIKKIAEKVGFYRHLEERRKK
jgi:hypothetical protein